MRFLKLIFIVSVISTNLYAADGVWESSVGFSFNKTTYSEGNYNWTRRWGASVGYHFTERSSVEIGFQDVVDRTKIVSYEDTTFHDQIYSLNWVQSFLPKTQPVQPYVKAGVAQLNREATGVYANGASPISRVDSVSALLGAGVRIYITRNLAIRTEATSYMPGGSIKVWKDNFAYTLGLSLLL